MADYNCQGIWTAIVCPFNEDGSIDYESFGKLLKRQQEAEVTGVVINGTTGESPTLTDEEKLSLISYARKALPKEVAVMAGTGSNCTRSTSEASRHAEEAGADALLIVTPPYNKPSPAGLLAHFEEICKHTTLPVCVYHVPGRTGQFLKAEDLAALGQLPQICSIKEASGQISYFDQVCQLTHDNCQLLSGDDPTFLPSLAVGGQGCISVISNLYPKALVAMNAAYAAGNNHLALAIHSAMTPLNQVLYLESNPGPVKNALRQMGYCNDYMRLPLVSVTAPTAAAVAQALSQVQENFATLGFS